MPSECTPLVGGVARDGAPKRMLASPRDAYDKCGPLLIAGLLALKALGYILFIVGDAYALAEYDTTAERSGADAFTKYPLVLDTVCLSLGFLGSFFCVWQLVGWMPYDWRRVCSRIVRHPTLAACSLMTGVVLVWQCLHVRTRV